MIETLNSIGISNAMITSTVLTVIICVIAIIAGKHVEIIPNNRIVLAIELGIEKLNGFFKDLMGERICKRYFPIVGTLFIYIMICNYTGLLPLAGELPGLAAPTSSINFPLGFAIVVFFATQIIGLREQGIKTYKRLIEPVALMFPLMLIEEFVRPFSLTLRLYGNIFGEESVVHAFFGLIPLGLPVIMQFLSVLMGLVQALVFSLLASIYITEVAEVEGELG